MIHALIVDDHVDNLYLLRSLLEGNGFSVDEARHGAEALMKARKQPPAVVVTDLLMPVVDGFTLLRHWKNDDLLKSIPVVVYTATYTDAKDERLAMDLGADAFLVKPAEPETVLATIREALRQSREGGHTARAPVLEETAALKRYNETLIRKLEKRAFQFEESNRELLAEIAECRRMEAALKETEEQYRVLFHAISDPVFVCDRETMKFLGVNAAAVEKYGYAAEEFLAMTIRDIELADGESNSTAMNASMGSRDQRGLFRHRKKNGEPIEVEVTASDVNFSGTPAFVIQARDVTVQRRLADSLRLRDRAIEAVSQGIVITDARIPGNPIIYASSGFERITGYPPEESVGKDYRLTFGKDSDKRALAEIEIEMSRRNSCSLELLSYRKDGTSFWNELTMSPVLDGDGALSHFVWVHNDVSQRRRLEDQFRQAQKMEAIGRLAGGVAHDFNNLLTVINGYSGMLVGQFAADDPQREFLLEIQKAGDRAATLTRQLLAFSRQQMLEPKVVDLNAVIHDTEKMLRRLIGEDIHLTTRLSPEIGRVRVDPGQIEQVLLNLAVNARDAMPEGGRLTIETQMAQLDEVYCRGIPELRPGMYVLLAVSDTGCGMSESVRARIFEPFFTTKSTGKGTGLGLATVHGIIRQTRGHVSVYSEPGLGTTFKIYLPVADEPARLESAASSVIAMPRGAETILLVEDEHAVRSLAKHILEECGYRVMEAPHGREALALAERFQDKIHLLVTDVVMPFLGGRALAQRLITMRPGCGVLFLSGYTDDAVIRHGVIDAEFAFLQKPFTPSALAQKVRQVLDAARRES